MLNKNPSSLRGVRTLSRFVGHWEAVWWVEEEVMGAGISNCKMHTKHLSILFKMQSLTWQVWGRA